MLVCFSHLRWNFVWQRPQHLMARFARTMQVVVVEEPVDRADTARLEVSEQGGVTVLTPHLPGEVGGFGPQTNAAISALITPLLANLDDGETILWYYTPMALGAEPAGVAPDLVVYDAMDDLASFRFAPRGLVEREAALMARADLVFAGGPTLHRTRVDRHPAVHCFPSGVEVEHFAQAANGIPRPADLEALRRPILGFYGVLDERVDFDLIAGVAALRPDWTVAMVGPLAKIGEEDLPQAPNIAYFGKQAYADLPGFLACFDVAILPFARNEATRSISPTKTLEYLAGGKPVVSTPIADVVDLYGQVVRVASTPERFVAAAESALAEGTAERAARLRQSERILARSTWDRIAEQMLAEMREAIGRARRTTPAGVDLRLGLGRVATAGRRAGLAGVAEVA